MSFETVVRVCGMWKRIRPSTSCSEHDLRHCLSIVIGFFSHSPFAARLAQSLFRSPIASHRSAFEQVTVSVWLAQIRWMWHDARQMVDAFFVSESHPPFKAKLTHVSLVS